jgi:hypothetical protein
MFAESPASDGTGREAAPDWKLSVSMKTARNVVRYAFALEDVPLP